MYTSSIKELFSFNTPRQKKWKIGLVCIQRFVTVKVDKGEIKFIILKVTKLGNNHKFFKNCTSCGLIFCQQNFKLTSCTFCTLPFDTEIPNTPGNSLKSALTLQNRLLAADLNSTGTSVKEEFSDFVQTNFCSNSEINARQREIENFKVKLAKEKEEKSTFDLSKMFQ